MLLEEEGSSLHLFASTSTSTFHPKKNQPPNGDFRRLRMNVPNENRHIMNLMPKGVCCDKEFDTPCCQEFSFYCSFL